MANAFIIFGLLIAANAYFFISSRRKARESQNDTEVEIVMMKPRRPLTLLFLWMFVLPVQAKDV